MKIKKWIYAPFDEPRADTLAEALGLSRLAARVLTARGCETPEAARAFMDKSSTRLGDPFLLPDMEKAVAAIEEALKNDVKIAVYGDYDVDGVTATCILIEYLESRGGRSTYYIPDRLGEGYGLNMGAIQSLHDQGCGLLITVDSGITAVEEADFAAGLGMAVIITDHHECKEQLPRAVAVVNPRREGSAYPFRELAGVGVAFKVITALESRQHPELTEEALTAKLLDRYADVVAVGTIADVMPLLSENRVIVSWGLGQLKSTRNLGLRALMQKLGLDQKPLTSNSVSFIMAPRINAAGRLGGASVAAKMFLTEDGDEAAQLAEHLCELNRRRQEEENNIFDQITQRLREEPHLTQGKTLVLWGDGWHNGVIGIVSSRLSDRYGIPCVLISMNGDSGKGSGRSIRGFNLYAALEKNAHLLEKYGGHELAVGLTVDRRNLPALAQALEDFADSEEVSDDVVPSVNIDCMVTPEEITLDAIRGFAVLEPFGMGNPQPALGMRDVIIEEITPISHDRHVKLLLSRDGKRFYAFVFGMGAHNCPFENGDAIDIVFAAEINTYKGRQNIQLIVKDIRWAEKEQAGDEAALALYRQFAKSGHISDAEARVLAPTKDELRAVFRYIKTNAVSKVLCADPRAIYRKIRYSSRSSINLGRLLICLDVFSEFDIFSYALSGQEIAITCHDYQGKADINGSKVLRRLIECIEG